MFVDEKMVQRMKEKYPPGSRIVLDYMGDDPRPIEPGTKGTVRMVDDIGTVHCDFDNGRVDCNLYDLFRSNRLRTDELSSRCECV